MRTIDITTTQKVTIQYELAGLRDRIFAFVLDWIFGLVFIFVMALLFEMSDLMRNGGDIFGWFVVLPTFLFYTLISEIILDGQSLGKKAIGIKVIKLDGKQATVMDYIMRWAFRMLDIYSSLGVVASLFISSSYQSQRLGGMTSNTTVIKVRFGMRFRLADILKINTLDDYEPAYPEVRQFNEEDMLLLRNLIIRARAHNNKAHQEAVELAAKQVAKRIDIVDIPRNRIEFLKTIIRDYIVLTR